MAADRPDSPQLTEPIVIVVRGRPRPQPRPRMSRSGHVVSVQDKDVKLWSERVRGTVRQALVQRYGYNFPGFDGPLRVDMAFVLPIKDAKKHGAYCTSKPDRDNLEKLCLDAMERAGVFSVGDQQVVCGEPSKLWGDELEAGVTIRISPPRYGQAGTDAVDRPEWLA